MKTRVENNGGGSISFDRNSLFLKITLVAVLLVLFNFSPTFLNISYAQPIIDSPDERASQTLEIRALRATEDSTGEFCPDSGAGFLNILTGKGSCVVSGIIYGLASFVLYILGLILPLVGEFLDFSIKFSILDIKQYFDSSGPGQITILWEKIRDIANILFIFFLLWISIQTILGLDNAKKYLVNIIIAALLINFSLFFTKVIIDTSNIVAVQFYNAVNSGCTIEGGSSGIIESCVSGKLTSATKLSSVFGENGIERTVLNVTLVSLFGIVLLFALMSAFILASFMFIGRTVAFIVLAALSPIAFVGRIIPATKKYSDQWWSTLLSQAYTAPIFLFFLWLIIFVSENLPEIPGDSATLASFIIKADSGSMQIFFHYFLILVLLFYGLKFSKEYSGSWGAGTAKVFGSVVGGAGGAAGRATLGWGARVLSDRLDSAGWAGGNLAKRLFFRGAQGVSESSLDVRSARIPLAGDYVSNITGKGLDMGRGEGKGGYRQAERDRIKEDTKYYQSLEPESQIAFKERLGEMKKPLSLGGFAERFVTGRSVKTAGKALREIGKVGLRKETEKVDEKKLDLLKVDYFEKVKLRKDDKEMKEVFEKLKLSPEKVLNTGGWEPLSNSEKAAIDKGYEDALNKALVDAKAKVFASRIVRADANQGARDVAKAQAELAKIKKMEIELDQEFERWKEYKRLQNTQAVRYAPSSSSSSTPKESGGGGSGNSGGSGGGK